MASHPSQPAITTYMFWIESLVKIYTKEWKVNHLNSICNTYNLEIGACQNLVLASHPSQPLFTTYIISKTEYLDELFCETQQYLQHIQFINWSLPESNSSKSPKSTTVYDIHHFKNRISRRIVLRDSTSLPSQPLFTTHIFSKIEHLEK
jgi:hypothetical protein